MHAPFAHPRIHFPVPRPPHAGTETSRGVEVGPFGRHQVPPRWFGIRLTIDSVHLVTVTTGVDNSCPCRYMVSERRDESIRSTYVIALLVGSRANFVSPSPAVTEKLTFPGREGSRRDIMKRGVLFATVAASAAVTANAAVNSSSTVPWADLAISAPSNGRYLYRTNSGEPFFWQADTAWELFHRLNRSDIEFYLQDRASKGFNVIQAVAIAELNGTTWPNFYGELPLVDRDPMQPNEAYFAHVDWAVTRAADYGILVALVPTWGAYVNCGWHGQSFVIFNETSAQWYGDYIGKRYPGLPKIIGADSNGFWSCNSSDAQTEYLANPSLDPASLLSPVEDSRALFASMANGLKEAEAEAGFTSFMTWHPTNKREVGTVDPYGHNVRLLLII